MEPGRDDRSAVVQLVVTALEESEQLRRSELDGHHLIGEGVQHVDVQHRDRSGSYGVDAYATGIGDGKVCIGHLTEGISHQVA